MVIDSYIQNRAACERKNDLLEQAKTRKLTESEFEELNILTSAINDFEERIMNFD